MTVLRRVVIIAIVFVAVTVALELVSASSPASTPAPWPTLKASATPNPADIAAIKTLVDNYFDITGGAAGTFDLSQFPTLFIDDPAVSLNINQTAFMTRVGAHGTGFLSYELAYFTNWKQGAEKIEKLQAQLKAQGRAMTAEDERSIAGPNGPPAARRQEPMHKTPLIFNSFSIDGSRATVECDSPSVLQKMFLIKVKDGWRIAGIQNLQVHV